MDKIRKINCIFKYFMDELELYELYSIPNLSNKGKFEKFAIHCFLNNRTDKVADNLRKVMRVLVIHGYLSPEYNETVDTILEEANV